MGIQFSKRITTMKILCLVALALAAVVVAEPEADADPHYYGYGYYGYPRYYGYRRYYGYPYRYYGKRSAEADPGVSAAFPKVILGPHNVPHGTPEEPLSYGYKIVKREAEAEPEANADAWGYYGYPYYRGYY